MQWDEWRGSMDGRPTLYVKHLCCRRGTHIDLHKIVGADDPECFHTHPAVAIRAILVGGYTEQLEDGRQRRWRPGMSGFVLPRLSHRISEIRNGEFSISLWIRFRKVAPIELRGSGWKHQAQTYRAPYTIITGDAA